MWHEQVPQPSSGDAETTSGTLHWMPSAPPSEIVEVDSSDPQHFEASRSIFGPALMGQALGTQGHCGNIHAMPAQQGYCMQMQQHEVMPLLQQAGNMMQEPVQMGQFAPNFSSCIAPGVPFSTVPKSSAEPSSHRLGQPMMHPAGMVNQQGMTCQHGMVQYQGMVQNQGMVQHQGMVQYQGMIQHQGALQYQGIVQHQGITSGAPMMTTQQQFMNQQPNIPSKLQQPLHPQMPMILQSNGAYAPMSAQSLPQQAMMGSMQMGFGMTGMPGMMDLVKAHFPAVGFFRCNQGTIEGLHEEKVYTVDDGIRRLTQLKMKVNELQDKRDGYWTRQSVNGGVAVASAMFTFGTSLLVQGPAAIHQNNSCDTLKREIQAMLGQVNQLRDLFGYEQRFREADGMVRIKTNVFKHGIGRNELRGEL